MLAVRDMADGGKAEHMGEAIVITSGKGGVGKTTTTANLGAGLAQAGKRVVMIDMDIGLRNLDVVCGLENRIIYHLVDVIGEKCSLDQALIQDGTIPNLFLLPSSQTCDKTDVTPDQMQTLVDSLKEDYDYILIDCPAGIEQGFRNAITGADRSIVVTTPDVSAVRDADRVIGMLEEHRIMENRILVNRIRMNLVRRGDMMSAEEIGDILGLPLIGIIPDDENVLVCAGKGKTLVGTDCPAGKALADMCHRVLGEEIEFTDPDPEVPEGRTERRRKRRERRRRNRSQNVTKE